MRIVLRDYLISAASGETLTTRQTCADRSLRRRSRRCWSAPYRRSHREERALPSRLLNPVRFSASCHVSDSSSGSASRTGDVAGCEVGHYLRRGESRPAVSPSKARRSNSHSADSSSAMLVQLGEVFEKSRNPGYGQHAANCFAPFLIATQDGCLRGRPSFGPPCSYQCQPSRNKLTTMFRNPLGEIWMAAIRSASPRCCRFRV